jgi:hypothetical protein
MLFKRVTSKFWKTIDSKLQKHYSKYSLTVNRYLIKCTGFCIIRLMNLNDLKPFCKGELVRKALSALVKVSLHNQFLYGQSHKR